MDLADNGRACRHVLNDLNSEIQEDRWGVTNGIPDALAHASGWRWLVNSSDAISVITLSLGYESESPSAQHSSGAWAARHANTAMAEIRHPLPIAKEKQSAPINSNLSRVDMCSWRLFRAPNLFEQWQNPALRAASTDQIDGAVLPIC
jgi:hypothetical protein